MEQNLHGARSFEMQALQEHIARLSDGHGAFTLYVGDGVSERVLHCTSGDMRIFSTGDRCGPGLKAYLLRSGQIDEPTLLHAVETSRKQQTSLREVLLSENFLGQHDYDTINSRCMRGEVLDLVFWNDAFFKVCATAPAPGVCRPEISTLAGSVDALRLGEEIAAWTSQWDDYRKVLSSDLSVLELTESGAEAARTASEQKRLILEACRGGTDLRTLWRTLSLDLPELCAHCVDLSKWNWLAATPRVEPPCEDNAAKTIALLEDFLPRAIEKDLVRERLVVLYRQRKSPDKACQHLRVLAHVASADQDWAAACERLRTVLTLKPDDLDAFDQCFKLYLDNDKKPEATIMAGHVAQVLIKRRNLPALEALSANLDAVGATPILAQEIRGDLYALWDEKEEAIREYQDLAKRLERRGDLDRAQQIARKALALDHSDPALRERLTDLKSRKNTAPQTANPPLSKSVTPPPAVTLPSSERVTPPHPMAPDPWRGSRRPPKSVVRGCTVILLITAVAYVAGIFDSAESDSRARDGALLPKPEEPLLGSAATPATRQSPPTIDPPVVPDMRRGSVREVTPPGTVPNASRRAPPPELLACSIGRQMRVRFARSRDLLVEDVKTGELLLRLYATEGDDWSIGTHGEVICRWKPGARVVFYTALSGTSETVLSWPLPETTQALAASKTAIAVREGKSTAVYSLAGTLLRKKMLPRWDRGVFCGTTLVLVADPKGANDSHESWVVDAQSLNVLWSD